MSEEDELPEDAFDRDLSALVDGALDPDRESELLRRIAADPRVAAKAAERREAFESLDRSLRALPAPALPADLRSRLDDRITRAQPDGGAVRRPIAREERGTTGPRTWWKPVVGALAAASVAGLLAYSTFGPRPTSSPPSSYVALQDVPESPRIEPARDALVPTAAAEVPAVHVHDHDHDHDREPDAAAWGSDDFPTEDLEMALEYETLRDLEVIRELDLLEALVAMNDGGRS